jgi:hypothetical protein
MSTNKVRYQSQPFPVSNAAASGRIQGLKLSKKLEQNLLTILYAKKH